MIYIIDDDIDMAKCISRSCRRDNMIFTNAIEAITHISTNKLPDLIFLDILLDGPDGFTFLNELASYSDTAQIPVIVVSSFDFTHQDLLEYGIVGVLNKERMTPQEIIYYVEKYSK